MMSAHTITTDHAFAYGPHRPDQCGEWCQGPTGNEPPADVITAGEARDRMRAAARRVTSEPLNWWDVAPVAYCRRCGSLLTPVGDYFVDIENDSAACKDSKGHVAAAVESD